MSRKTLFLVILVAAWVATVCAQAPAETPQIPGVATVSATVSAPAPEPAPVPQNVPISAAPQEGQPAPVYGTVVQNPPAIPDNEVPYGMSWYGTLKEAEWSPFDSPFGPYNFWDAYTWGFIRFRTWFDCERFGGCWPPFWSSLGWGYDPWYGGWYGWLPNGVPAGYSPSPLQRPAAPHRPAFRFAQFDPVEVITARPPVRPAPEKKRGWFHPQEPRGRDESPRPVGGSFGGSHFGGGRGSSGGFGGAAPPVTRPAPPPSRPRVR